jgi:hypothetical protein
MRNRDFSVHGAILLRALCWRRCAIFFDGLNPKLEGRVLAQRISEVGAKLNLIEFAEQVQIKRNCARQAPDVVAVAFDIAFQLCEREIVEVRCHEKKVLERSRKHLLQSTLVSIGWLR